MKTWWFQQDGITLLEIVMIHQIIRNFYDRKSTPSDKCGFDISQRYIWTTVDLLRLPTLVATEIARLDTARLLLMGPPQTQIER